MSTLVSKLTTAGGFIGGVITLLAFFGVDAKTIKDQMTAHYWFLVAAIALFGVCAWGIYSWWQSSRVTPGNVQRKIRQWFDIFNLSHRVHDFDPWHFTYVVTFIDELPIFVGRPRSWAGRYISILARINGTTKKQKAVFDRMSETDQRDLFSDMFSEAAKARITFRFTPDITNITIEKRIPITDQLSESDIMESLDEIYRAAIIIWSVSSLHLDEDEPIKKPSIGDSPFLATGATGATGDVMIPLQSVKPPNESGPPGALGPR